jgi:hypothetical protein
MRAALYRAFLTFDRQAALVGPDCSAPWSLPSADKGPASRWRLGDDAVIGGAGMPYVDAGATEVPLTPVLAPRSTGR